jgi:hypothetical protein
MNKGIVSLIIGMGLSHSIFYTGGDKQEAIEILDKCLEVDNKSKYCKDLLKDMKTW